MGIVKLEGHFLIEFTHIIMLAHIFFNSFLNGCRDEEILLL